MKILICSDMFPAMIETVTRLLPGDEVRVCLQKDVPAKAPWAEVLIPAMTRLTPEIIQSAPDLKLIQQFGVGLEGVDLEAATARGIPVANVPGDQAPVHAECTAEGGVFLMTLFIVLQVLNHKSNSTRSETLISSIFILAKIRTIFLVIVGILLPC